MALPDGARRLIASGDFEGRDNQTLVRWLASDKSLAGRLLRWCNTPLFDLARQFGRLEEAAKVMDNRDLARLAVLAWVRNLFEPDVRIDIYGRDFLWCHGIAVGSVASMMARTTGLGDTSNAFVAGALHDIGLCASERLDPVGFGKILTQIDALSPTQEVELDHQGWDHAQLGGQILRSWGMSRDIYEAAALHHEPERAIGTSSQWTVGFVALANYFCSRSGQGSTGSHHISPPSPAVMESIGIDSSILPVLWQQVPAAIAASRRIR